MSSTFRRAYRIHKRNLLEATIDRSTHTHLPPFSNSLVRRGWCDVIVQRKIRLERFNWELVPIKGDDELLPCPVGHAACNIVCTLGQKRHGVVIERRHLEPGEVWPERYLGVVALLLLRSSALLHNRLLRLRHVVAEDLLEFLSVGGIEALYGELNAEDVGELCSVAVTASSRLLLVIVEVRPCEQVSEDKSGDVAIVLLMHHDWNSLTIIFHRDEVTLRVDLNVELVHVGVTLLVVRSIDKDFVINLV
mmetsp:Transcript_42332/g.128418  ORF Transcript_42332/g.128418 Transcript_42332/m.128418 type:complete len:249 (+) Transcript_42332:3682-4428(+)